MMFLLLHLQNADANASLYKEWQDTMIEDSASVINLADYFYCWGRNIRPVLCWPVSNGAGQFQQKIQSTTFWQRFFS